MSLSKRDVAAILAAHAIAGLLFLSPAWIRPDSVGVMSWLRSAAIDGDLLFFDEWAGFAMLGNGFAWFKEVTTVGALANHWWVGTSILSAPFWGASHFLSRLLPGAEFPDDGFFGLDLATLGWTSVLFGAAAMIAAAAIAREIDPDGRPRHVSLALIATSLGTPAFWYVFRMPVGTHAAGMMLVGGVAFLCWRLVSRPDEESPVLLGLVFGLATVTRLQHALLLPAVVAAGVRSGRSIRFYARFAAGATLPLAVQAVAWHAIYGTPLGPLAAGANLQGVTWMPFRSFPLFSVLFSSWHGLLSWSPIVIVAIAGWVLLFRDGGARRDLAVVFALMFAGELLANVALDRYWWGGMSFGARRFSDLAVPFVVGVAAAVRWRPRIASLTVALCALWSIVLMLAAAVGTLSLSRYVGYGDVATAVRSIPGALAFPQLNSPITSASLLMQSLLALWVVGMVAWFLTAIVCRLAIPPAAIAGALCGAALLAALLLVAPTRSRAPRELTRFKLDGPAARSAGALLDQRGLLLQEAAWLRARGTPPALDTTQREIAAIDQRLRELGIE